MPSIMPESNNTVKHGYVWGCVAEEDMALQNTPMKNLRAIRKNRGLSQAQLAEAAGCTQGIISRIEKGEANPTLDMIENIARALRTTPVALFGLSELQQRVLDAIEAIPPDSQEAALIVLEAMTQKGSTRKD